MKVPDQDDLAWDLLDEVRTSLDVQAINRVSMTMADRDYPAVIEILLSAAAAGGLTLTGEVLGRLREWADFYPLRPLATQLIQRFDDAS